ncbi:M14 family zinc carboxypeptidase [Aequorivita todarodis]|uniref:M14 family zinc carboxypeptidase n=1 Tax=Aequorivita todarodis TaxID=2036821 RepID=UPI002350DF6B|nr:M14 family zinc carboxypeptidase [Aequorivita todarodis]MDC7999808.1 M14 family zinc carboxypeptidase [Aequorivita todarodis]
MEINGWYRDHFEFRIGGRYIAMRHIYPLLDMYKLKYEISVPGLSEMGQDIPLIKIGGGSEIVLGWSQMHGNESTTTKALFDFLKFISQKQYFQTEIEEFLHKYTFYVFPILNPDGAKLYTRENANNIDLNRDAKRLSQKESQCLRKIFDAVKPSLCLNLHDQRSIYGFKDGKPATVSFLAPAADEKRTTTDSRKIAMQQIVKMNTFLQQYIPGQVGRYDDSFNEACVGDTFQKAGVPTILFEAGHFNRDYQRETTREFIFYSLLSLFEIIGGKSQSIRYGQYFDIPENLKNYNDFILRNVKLPDEKKLVSIAVQYEEVLRNDEIIFSPVIDAIGNLKNKFGHKEKDAKGAEILTNSQDKLTVGTNISEIIDKFDKSIIYFQ